MSEFADLRREVTGSSWLDDVVRASLLSAERIFDGAPSERLLRVQVGRSLDASTSSELATGMQGAIARMAHFLHDPKTDAIQLRKDHVSAAPLYLRAVRGRVLEFAFEEDDSDSDSLFGASSAFTAGAAAAHELLEILPANESDTDSLDAMFARSTAIMNAVAGLSQAVKKSNGAEFELSGGGSDTVNSELTSEQATTLAKALDQKRTVRRTVELEGVLDGVRTRRRVFYLETGGADISGAFESDLSDAVVAHLGQIVEAKLEETRTINRLGRRGAPRYRLLGLSKPLTLSDS